MCATRQLPRCFYSNPTASSLRGIFFPICLGCTAAALLPRPVHCSATALSNQGNWPTVRHGSRLPLPLLVGRPQNQRVEVINTNPPAESM
jgi:hypothetical protein